MPIQYRKQHSFGPLKFNVTQNGFSSWSIKLGRWSWNSRTKEQRYDLPGPFTWRSRRGRANS